MIMFIVSMLNWNCRKANFEPFETVSSLHSMILEVSFLLIPYFRFSGSIASSSIKDISNFSKYSEWLK